METQWKLPRLSLLVAEAASFRMAWRAWLASTSVEVICERSSVQASSIRLWDSQRMLQTYSVVIQEEHNRPSHPDFVACSQPPRLQHDAAESNVLISQISQSRLRDTVRCRYVCLHAEYRIGDIAKGVINNC
jgi:hypothetical protein